MRDFYSLRFFKVIFLLSPFEKFQRVTVSNAKQDEWYQVFVPRTEEEILRLHQNVDVVCMKDSPFITSSRFVTATLHQVAHRAGSSNGKCDTGCRDRVQEASLSGVWNKQEN
jgi:hypothetical protein